MNTTTEKAPYAPHETDSASQKTPEIPHESSKMEMDPIGNYFGDYNNYSLAELGLDDDKGFVNHSALIDEDDEEADECEPL